MRIPSKTLAVNALAASALVAASTAGVSAASPATTAGAAALPATTVSKIVYQGKTVPYATKLIPHHWMWKGTSKLGRAGSTGYKVLTWKITYTDGHRSAWLKRVHYIRYPHTKIVFVGVRVKPHSTTSSSSTSVWDRLASCESGGNWSINTGNGYYGGLQFSLSTWRGLGAPGYPHQASKATQIHYAQKLRGQVGSYRPWPTCARRLGLPT